MASAFSHAVFAVSLCTVFPENKLPKHAWVIGVIGAAMPDLDSIGFLYGIPYAHVLGHRGITHSLAFAALFSASMVSVLTLFHREQFSASALLLYLFLCTASHGVFDAMTDGGLGIAFFAPFDNERYFFPWRPIAVSPISVTAFFSERGLAAIRSEILWIWIPCLLLVSIRLPVWIFSRRDAHREEAGG